MPLPQNTHTQTHTQGRVNKKITQEEEKKSNLEYLKGSMCWTTDNYNIKGEKMLERWVCVCFVPWSLMKHGKVKSTCWAPSSKEFFFFFFAWKERSKKIPLCVWLVSFPQSFHNGLSHFPLLICCASTLTKQVSIYKWRRAQSTTSLLPSGQTARTHINPEPWFDLVSRIVSPDFTEAFPPSISVSLSLFPMWLKLFCFFSLSRFMLNSTSVKFTFPTSSFLPVWSTF